EVAVLDRCRVRGEDDVVQKRELGMDEKGAVDRGDDWDLEVEERERLFCLVDVEDVVSVAKVERRAKVVARPALFVKCGDERVAGTGEDDELVLRVEMNVEKGGD